MNESYSRPRILKPLVVTLTHTEAERLPVPAKLVDLLSLLCFSRPAALLLERPGVPDYSAAIWWGDLFHLLLLVLLGWTAVVVVFLSAERQWPRLIGLGES